MDDVTPSTRHQTHERLLGRVRLSERRLTRLATELDADEDLKESELRSRVDELLARCSDLSDRIHSWNEVEVGALTAVEDLAAGVDSLQTDLLAARATERADYEEAVDSQVRVWRTRVDRLRLQRELASMEAREELEALTHRLEDARSGALDDLQGLVGDARKTVVDLRSDMEQVFVDVREAVEHAAAALTKDQAD
jgi:ribosome assembly protein YihI (activator of Der GTPase)